MRTKDGFRRSWFRFRWKNSKGELSRESFTEDEPAAALEGLAKLKTAFAESTPPHMWMVLMSMEEARKRNLVPLPQLFTWGVAGVEPKVMGPRFGAGY